ncbi:hypothetical protein EVAR_3865_1 [Eumeta japonica]|uniref:DUF4780 domain-containing protein n=1 Tax=Eumeta variegata TaxID=151549 RepID=A0A4C1SR94_EUMVA|nr:hypothetical protein EVAR_3865_1 [Eumeta japonica]
MSNGEADVTEVASPLRMAVVTRPRLVLPRFRSNPILRDGVLYVECWDELSVQKLRKYFSDDEEQEYNRLDDFNFSIPSIEFVAEDNIPKLVKCSVTVPNSFESVWDLHFILKAQNEDYHVDEWFYHSSEGKGISSSTLTITYYVPEEIVAAIQKENSEPSFGFGCVILDIHKDRD